MIPLFWEIAIGILAGFLAGQIMRGRGYGVLLDLVLGLVGAVIGASSSRCSALAGTDWSDNWSPPPPARPC